MKKAYWGSVVSSFVGLGLMLACLRQWGSPAPWARLDLYSGGFMVATAVVAISEALTFLRRAFQSREVMREALGLSYDPGLPRWGIMLSVADLAVVLDYGHWHLVPALEKPLFQTIGLGLIATGAALLFWTDFWLARHFSTEAATAQLVTRGPYRYVRHPRYAAFLAGRVALALVLASVLAWIVLLPWLFLILRRTRREETHLRTLFGADYEAYAARTPRLLPGVYMRSLQGSWRNPGGVIHSGIYPIDKLGDAVGKRMSNLSSTFPHQSSSSRPDLLFVLSFSFPVKHLRRSRAAKYLATTLRYVSPAIGRGQRDQVHLVGAGSARPLGRPAIWKRTARPSASAKDIDEGRRPHAGDRQGIDCGDYFRALLSGILAGNIRYRQFTAPDILSDVFRGHAAGFGRSPDQQLPRPGAVPTFSGHVSQAHASASTQPKTSRRR